MVVRVTRMLVHRLVSSGVTLTAMRMVRLMAAIHFHTRRRTPPWTKHGRRHGAPNGQEDGQQDQDEGAEKLHSR